MLLDHLDTAYQATDLARSHREVLDAARSGGASIRDKDGLMLVMMPAEEVNRSRMINDYALDIIRLTLAYQAQFATLAKSEVMPDPAAAEPGYQIEDIASYGHFSWLSVLPFRYQVEFLGAISRQVLLASSGIGTRSLQQLIGDWRATAETWMDPDAREQLLEEMNEPGREL